MAMTHFYFQCCLRAASEAGSRRRIPRSSFTTWTIVECAHRCEEFLHSGPLIRKSVLPRTSSQYTTLGQRNGAVDSPAAGAAAAADNELPTAELTNSPNTV
jgi:hypothetical protein